MGTGTFSKVYTKRKTANLIVPKVSTNLCHLLSARVVKIILSLDKAQPEISHSDNIIYKSSWYSRIRFIQP